MEDIKTFLESCGLSEAIPVFEKNKIRVDHLNEMTSDDFKELLPALGDRIELRKAIERRRGRKSSICSISKSEKKRELAPTKHTMKNDPGKKAFVVEMLKKDQHVAELYEMTTSVLIELKLFSFHNGCRQKSKDWTLIDFVEGTLNCLLCTQKILIQKRDSSGKLWNVGNYKRHFINEHKNDLRDILGTEETRNINSFLEVPMTAGDDETLSTPDGTKATTSHYVEGLRKGEVHPAGNNSGCHLYGIEIRCTKKRSETILKRPKIVDISSDEDSHVNRVNIDSLKKKANTSGCSVESQAIDSVVGIEAFPENGKTNEVSTEGLEIEEVPPSIDAKKIHKSSEKTDKTLGDVSEPMVEGSGEFVITSVITENIGGNSHRWKCTNQQKLTFEAFGASDQLKCDTEISETNVGGKEQLPKSDGAINKADDLTTDATTDNLNEILIQKREGGGMLWNFTNEHKNDLNETLSTLDGTKASTSNDIEIRCIRKRGAPDTFNETISKRPSIVDISSGCCVESTVIDSMVGIEAFPENGKTDEVSAEELEIDEVPPSSDVKKIHNSSKKIDKTLDGVSEPMFEGSGGSGEFVMASVITENIGGNSHHWKCTSQQKLAFEEFGASDQLKCDTEMSDGAINQVDDLTADVTTDNLIEIIKTGEKISNAHSITSAVTVLTLTPNEALSDTEVTPTPIPNQLDADDNSSKFITETIPTGLVGNRVDEISDAVLLQETKNDNISTSTNQVKGTAAPNDWATLNETETIQVCIGTMENVSISSGCEKFSTARNSVALINVAEPDETSQKFTEIQQKLALEVLVEEVSEQDTEDVLPDVSKQLVTDKEMSAVNISSSVIKPDGKTSTFVADITIATTTENNKEEKLGPVPEWQKTGVKFGWARKSSKSKFYPGFLSLNDKFHWITTKAVLSNYSFKPIDFNEEINQNAKDRAQIGHLLKFNKTNGTSFE